MDWKESDLWKKAFNHVDKQVEARKRLEVAYEQFRYRATLLAESIPRDVPGLTDHSVRHLDALWEMASLLAPKEMPFNPVEAFILGGAILLHDLANTIAAFPNGLNDLRDSIWNDIVHAHYRSHFNRAPSADEILSPAAELREGIVLERLREAHAKQAESLATFGFFHPSCDASHSEQMYLCEDEDLREKLGPLIGRIAHSHHWDVVRVVTEYPDCISAPPFLPVEWEIDPLKIAFLLRAADAAHIDERRAPTFVMALRHPAGLSRKHWTFQNLLSRPIVSNDRLVYRSFRGFRVDEVDAWWLCFETLNLIHGELSAIDDQLSARRSFRFTARAVEGHGNPQAVQRTIATSGWTPIDARIHITDVLGVVRKFGGVGLYGFKPSVPVRELIMNAVDAIRARRKIEERPEDWGEIVVRYGRTESEYWIEVEDNGIGMSPALMAGPLLDFGTSYWTTSLARKEHPGLYSSGFEPAGRYGVGFFSVFMLGDHVKVISRPAGLQNLPTSILDFKAGISFRPVLREPANKSETRHEPGTCVRVLLKDKPYERWEIEERSASISALAPSLDVSVKVEIVGTEPGTKQAIKANDWLTVDIVEVLKRVDYGRLLDSDFGHGRNTVSAEYTEVQRERARSTARIFLLNGVPVARLCFSRPLTDTYREGSLQTVDGFRSSRGPGLFEGIVRGSLPNLRRSHSEWTLTTKDFAAWLVEIEETIANSVPEAYDLSHYAALYLRSGIRPRLLRFWPYEKRFLTADEAVSLRWPKKLLIGLSPHSELLGDRRKTMYAKDKYKDTTLIDCALPSVGDSTLEQYYIECVGRSWGEAPIVSRLEFYVWNGAGDYDRVVRPLLVRPSRNDVPASAPRD